GDAKTSTELTKEKIKSALSSKDASYILEKISCNTERVLLLQKGLNFSIITPTSIPATEIVAKVESAIIPLDTEQADSVKRTVNNLLQKAQPP
ncbi:unnamed protein product, partial [Porites lobata]